VSDVERCVHRHRPCKQLLCKKVQAACPGSTVRAAARPLKTCLCRLVSMCNPPWPVHCAYQAGVHVSRDTLSRLHPAVLQPCLPACRVAALLAAKHAIEHEGRQAVAILAGDTVASAPLQDFLARADSSCRAAAASGSSGRAAGGGSSGGSSSGSSDQVPSPVIPNLYDRVARWHMQQYCTTREQLVRASALTFFLPQQAQLSHWAQQETGALLRLLSTLPRLPVL
jgi:hypothetical protein